MSSFLLSQTLTPFTISSPTALAAGKADNTVVDVTQIPYAQGGAGSMIGTGPFKFDSWTLGDNVKIVKNPDYWNADKAAHLDEVIFKPVAEEAQRLNGLSTGELDLVQTVAPIDVATIASNPELAVIDRGESCNLFHFAMNQNYTLTKNPKIREAIAYAINKDALIETFYAGQGVAADNWMPPGTQYYKPLALPTYDPEKAKALIAESGETDLTLDFWYPSDVTRPYMPDPKGIFEAIASDLEAVGFTINPNTATWSPDYLDAEFAGEYPAWLIGWTCDWAGPDNFLRTAFFNYVDGKPSPEFAYTNDELEPDHVGRPRGDRRGHRPAAVGEGAGPHPRRHPHRPAGQLDPARRNPCGRQGLRRQRRAQRVPEHGLARPLGRAWGGRSAAAPQIARDPRGSSRLPGVRFPPPPTLPGGRAC